MVRRLGGYAAFDSSPPAIMFVAEPAKMIVAPHNTLIQQTFEIPPLSDALKAAHLACFHLIAPDDVPIALKERPFRVGDRTYIDWKKTDTSSLQRRALSPLTALQPDLNVPNPTIEWSAFCSWLLAIDGYRGLSVAHALNQLRLDQIAWAARKLPMPLFAHAIGLRPMSPLPRIALARQAHGLVPPIAIDEMKVDRETQVAELVDMVDEETNGTFSQHDVNLIEGAIDLLSTKASETADQHIDRWVRGLLSLRAKASRASPYGGITLSWIAEVCESGTVSKDNADYHTRARYPRVSAIPLLLLISKLPNDPSKWDKEELEQGYLKLMNDHQIRDKVGLAGGIASFQLFAHENWGTPLASVGIHKLIPPPRPRAQFITEHEVQRAVQWTYDQRGADEHLLKMVRVALALGWAAPFRIQELQHLRIGNISPLKDGGYEIEIIPRRGKKLKSPSATRRVKISPGWAAILVKDWLALRSFQAASPKEYLFGTDSDPMKPYRQHALRTTLLHVLKATTGDPAMTFHAMRHSWASLRVSEILGSSSIVDYNRLISVADAMGHVSAATTLFFYSHLAEDVLNLHITHEIREVLKMESSAANRLLSMKPNTVRQNGARKYGWDAETSLWQAICDASQKMDLDDCSAGVELVDPPRPRLGKNFIRTITPAVVLTVLRHLQQDKLNPDQISAAARVSTGLVEAVQSHAIDLTKQWLQKYRHHTRDEIQVASVNGAVFAMGLDLNTTFKSKYRSLLTSFSVGLDVSEEVVQSWLKLRQGVYLSALPGSHLRPLLKLFSEAGIAAHEFVVLIQSDQMDPAATLNIKAEVSLAFRAVWNLNPKFTPRGFEHGARPDAYIAFPGDGKQDNVGNSSYASVKGVHALLFAVSIYSRIKEQDHGTS